MSLSSKLTDLTLDIQDKRKTVDLLENIITEQSGRHSVEQTDFQRQVEESLKRKSAENDDVMRELLKANEALLQKKEAIESRIAELAAEKQKAEADKKASIEAIKHELADTKERYHQAHLQQKEEREKAWLDKRITAIENMTLVGIQPTIDRLIRKHQEDCEEIASNKQVTKQKLEVQCEEELLSRVQEFQCSEQSARSSITNRNDFAHALANEQNENIARLKKLKDSLLEEEDNAKKLYEMENHTLLKQNEAILNKVLSKSCLKEQYLEQNLKGKIENRRYELQSDLDHIDRELVVSKKEWEHEFVSESRLRVERQNEQKKQELSLWRDTKVNELIRANVIEQAWLESETKTPDESAEHAKALVSLQRALRVEENLQIETKAKLTAAANQKEQLQTTLAQLQQELDAVSVKLDDAEERRERKHKQHHDLLKESSLQTEGTLESICRRQEKCKLEIGRINARIDQDPSNHNVENSVLEHKHERDLDDLQHQATHASNDLDRKLKAMKNLINEKEVYLKKAQDLLLTRYQH